MLGRILAITAFAILGLVSAQDNPTTPSVCAVGCVSGVFSNAASIGCSNGDTACVCNNTGPFHDGIRDCIVQACAADGPDAQIPLAVAYGNQVCADANALPPPTSSAAPPPDPTPTEAASTTDAPSSTIPVPSAEITSAVITSERTIASTVESAVVSSSVTDSGSTIAPAPSSTDSATVSESSMPTASASTSTSSSSTISSNSAPTATSSTSTATTGLSTAAKAGIGAGVGAAALAAIIIAVCVCLRRRQQKKSTNRVRHYKISEPMTNSNYHFANDISRAETALPRPINTTRPARADSTAIATSPTSVYSSTSDLETHARRYEDMLPRTQPRTMI
ncbi:putative cfem domain protein [Rosellinia necatrix]|uniref:Putative cfem domain protein n=1 Tax=Rosellinia necatrix TaxID=77044 RepID=A0A1W2TCQ0_ROSNE|nr:putative cfem domain protein [Rosellinia necatrix]